MKSPWFILVLSLFLVTHAFAEAPKVNVQVRFYELSGQAALARNLRLRSGPGTDVLTMPSFAMVSGKSAEVSVERDFAGANAPKNMPKVGVHLIIRAAVQGERILVSVDSKRVDYLGPQAGNRHVFAIGKRTNMRGSPKYGEPVRFDLGMRVNKHTVSDEETGREEVKTIRRRVVATLIFTRA